MVIAHTYVRPSGLPNPYHKCVEVKLNKEDRFVAPIKSIEGAAHLIGEDEEAEAEDAVLLVNNHTDLETYYYVY